MANLLIAAVLVLLLLRVLGEGESIELEDLAANSQLAALAAFLGLLVFACVKGGAGALTMSGLASCGVLIALFPERMPDGVRGGASQSTYMTAFWAAIGWALIVLAYLVIYALGRD